MRTTSERADEIGLPWSDVTGAPSVSSDADHWNHPMSVGRQIREEVDVMPVCWRAVEGDVIMPVAEAEWWGASLGILVAAIHHPDLLRSQQPDTDPAEVAKEVKSEISELLAAASCAERQASEEDDELERSRLGFVRREGGDIRVCPGADLGNLGWCLEIFAEAVLSPSSDEATVACGATAYSASAWSRAIGEAAATL